MKKLLLFCLFLISLSINAQTPPNWTVTDCNGASYTLHDLIAQNKAVIVDMGAQWCGPCQSAAPYIQELYELYGENQEDVIFLGMLYQNVSGASSTCETITEWDTDLNLHYPTVPASANGSSNNDAISTLFNTYNVTGIPFFIMFVPDPDTGHPMVAYNDNDTTEPNFYVGIKNALAAHNYQEGGELLDNEEFGISTIFSVYPNPATDILKVETNSATTLKSIKVISIRGNVVKELSGDNSAINISDLTSGVYFLEAQFDKGTKRVKFIKS
ncbi:T9SS type A sorting domain-containing protein [Aureivirga marina]|uniref:T9SS type A sorting domain-containing protein n=1 Tax=Aureivirga marina TaxID=1182451 RepID=UPI0018CB511A|nr:T9SS type A sorting domain-containing protein [Aureivirga marina]